MVEREVNLLIIIAVNKVNRSINVFEAVKAYQENKLTNPIYYLSTNIVP